MAARNALCTFRAVVVKENNNENEIFFSSGFICN